MSSTVVWFCLALLSRNSVSQSRVILAFICFIITTLSPQLQSAFKGQTKCNPLEFRHFRKQLEILLLNCKNLVKMV